MRGSQIIVSGSPKGTFLEGTIQGTNLYPGIAVSVVLGVAADGSGNMTWQPLTSTSFLDPRLKAILLNDDNQGFIYSVAYITGTRCKIYCPLPGEDMNLCVAAQVGTGSANAYTVGERLAPSNSTGQFTNSSVSSSSNAWATVMEHIDITADVVGWVWCKIQ